ncbi:MAG: hypothetical protein ACRDTJ_10105 [Pseudonocardiaceae bacterium]
MWSAHRAAQAAGGRLARLVAVVAVLAGLAVLQAPQCTDGMIAGAGYLTQGASPAMAVVARQDLGVAMVMTGVNRHPQGTAAQGTAHSALGAHAGVGGSPSRSGDMGGVLATCLAFLVAFLVVIVGLYPSWLRTFVRIHAPGHEARVCAIAVRAPSLSQLCVLRT